MSTALALQAPELPPLPIGPSQEAWAAMGPEARLAFQMEALAALQAAWQAAPSEGSSHGHARFGARRALMEHFSRVRHLVYLNSDLPVVYPGERVFAPDLIVVLGVDDPGEDDTRMAWVVTEEGRGLNLVLEVLHMGDRRKDLVDNVARYAALGIEEYFVYDRRYQRIHGWRLAEPGARVYDVLHAEGGQIQSRVLGLGIGILRSRLRFFAQGNLLESDRDLLRRANGVIDDVQARAEESERRAEQEAQRAEAAIAKAEAEAQRAEREAKRAEKESKRAEREAKRAEKEAQRAEAAIARAEAAEAELQALRARLQNPT